MNYSDWLQAVVTILQVSDAPGIGAFTALAPRFIERAENLLYADPELDFQFCRAVDDSKKTTGGLRAVAIPNQFMVVEGVSIVTPANTLPSTAGGARIPLLRMDRSFLDLVWPVESVTQAPNSFQGGYYAIFSQLEASPAAGSADEVAPLPSAILLAPTPDDVYFIEVTGTARPAPLSAGNTATPLTTYYPALFLAATLVVAIAYQRDWSAQSDDPKLALSWEAEFQKQRVVALGESLRQKAWGPEWNAHGFKRVALQQPPPPTPSGGGD